MKPLYDVMTREERTEVDSALDPSQAATEASADLTRKVREFVHTKVLIKDDAIARWASADPVKRARMISEIRWRVTCIHEASDTAVEGVTNFSLGYGFHLKADMIDGRACYVVH
jgi:hypothetical protein